MISKSLSTSAKVAALHRICPKMAEFCRVLFVLLVAHADDHARLQGDELTVKLQVDPISPRKLPDFVAALHLLHEVGLILWYQVGDRKVIEIVKFSDHQDLKGHDKRPAKLPACPGVESYIGRKNPTNTGMGESLPQTSLKRTEEKGTELKGREEKGRQGGSSATSAEPMALLTFPTVGTDGKTWDLTVTQASEWQALYPSMDILAEARVALAWVRANPGRQKTAGGMARFLVNWFNRSNNGRTVPTALTTAGRTAMLSDATKGFLES